MRHVLRFAAASVVVGKDWEKPQVDCGFD